MTVVGGLWESRKLPGLHPSISVCLVLPLRGEALACLEARQPPLHWPRCVEEDLSKQQGDPPLLKGPSSVLLAAKTPASSATLAWHRAQHIVGPS